MADTVNKNEALEGFVIDLNGWRVRDFRNFMTSLAGNDFDTLASLIGQVVSEWPFEGDPGEPESFMDLNFNELGRLLRAVNASMLGAFSQGN